MRLIATVGAGNFSNNHNYTINNKTYQKPLSFLALAEAYKIKDIIVIGTKQSQNSIQYILNNYPNIKIEVIESSDVEDVFQKSLEFMTNDTILDLTQGYRHYPMLTLLASIFLQNNQDSIKDIFYAQTTNENCQPYKESCEYKFTSLIKYLDIANMARIINTFNKTLLTLDYKVTYKDFMHIKELLENLTVELFSNNFNQSNKEAAKIISITDKILKQGNLDIVQEHLKNLKDEMQKIERLKAKNESETLLNVSQYFLDKDILLHSVTLLYESMVAFLDENINLNKCNRYKEKKANTYQRRNCLKLNMGNCYNSLYKNSISQCEEFSKTLKTIDRLRNTSAHAHTTGTYHQDLKEEIRKAINFLKPIIKKDISITDKIDTLQDMFK